ncbi:MAG: hypothetical protein HKL92_01550 [Candidatus Eremiobacteraeota bacterium]|nr:hypothetical protein [Candidatus Eremiobacteraeota bacterium]
MPRSYFSPTTPADLPAARRRRASLAVAGAIVAHLLALFLVARFVVVHFQQQKAEKTQIVALATMQHLAPKTVPQPASPQQHRQQPQQPPQPARQAQPAAAPRTMGPTKRPRRLRPHGRTPPTTSLDTAQQFVERQEAQLAREAARINANRAPLSTATSAPDPSSFRRSIVDSGGVSRTNYAEAYILPLQHWFSGGLSCYYVRYAAAFSQGGNEKGEIPWPVCYPRDHDELAHGPYPHRLPVPYPQPGYRLPRGTYLTPFMQQIYNHRPA